METNISEKKSKSVADILGQYVSEKAFFAYVVCFMTTIPVGELITELLGENFISQPIIHSFFGWVGLCMAGVWFVINIPQKNIKPSDIFYLLLLFFLLVSYVFSKEREVSANRNFYEETIPNFFAYYSLMFAATHIEKYKLRKRILGVFIGLALAESILCVFQSLGMRIMDSCFDPVVHANEKLSYGLAQHQNFYGALSVLFFGASAGLFVLKAEKKWLLPSGLLVALVLYGSLSTSARLTWLGNGAIIIFLLVSILIMRGRLKEGFTFAQYLKRFMALFLISIAVIGVVLCSSDKIQSEIIQSEQEIIGEKMSTAEHAETGNTGNLGNGRVYLWSFAFEALPNNWLTGVGPDNFRWCFYNSPRWHHPMWYNDKAHNEFIHTMITLGIPALLNYILLLFFAGRTAIRKILKMENKQEVILTWIFLGMMAGYIVQSLVNSSVINIAMYFWVTVGMTMPRFTQKWRKKNSKDEKDECGF